MGSFAELGKSSRHIPDGGESMRSNDDNNSTDPKQTPNLHPDPVESDSPAGWLDALNLFLDRALKADIDTGC